jgi:hypothetical protein
VLDLGSVSALAVGTLIAACEHGTLHLHCVNVLGMVPRGIAC